MEVLSLKRCISEWIHVCVEWVGNINEMYADDREHNHIQVYSQKYSSPFAASNPSPKCSSVFNLTILFPKSDVQYFQTVFRHFSNWLHFRTQVWLTGTVVLPVFADEAPLIFSYRMRKHEVKTNKSCTVQYVCNVRVEMVSHRKVT